MCHESEGLRFYSFFIELMLALVFQILYNDYCISVICECDVESWLSSLQKRCYPDSSREVFKIKAELDVMYNFVLLYV